MEYLPVLSKRDFTRRYAAGEFGNASPTWHEFDHFEAYAKKAYPTSADASHSEQKYHLRNRIAGGTTYYNQSAYSAYYLWFNQPNWNDWYVSAMAPTEKTLFQGEVVYLENGINLFYTTVAKPMRDALRERSHQVSGIIAVSLLRYYLCPNSYDWLQVLLDRYPAHVVEFSTYSTEWGTVPGYNTVFWEVRNY